jgi:hypothetical protein
MVGLLLSTLFVFGTMIKQRELTGAVTSIGTMIKRDRVFGSLTFQNDDQGMIIFSFHVLSSLFLSRSKAGTMIKNVIHVIH